MPRVTEEQFSELLQAQLGSSWDRALAVFKNYGQHLAYDVTNVLMHAADQKKADEVLLLLEKHYTEHLQFQHPDIRGTVENLGVNPTERVFLHICRQVLGLQPAA